MKKLFYCALLITHCALLFSGCGAEKKIGAIKYPNVSEEAFIKFYEQTADSGQSNSKYIFFADLNSMAAALKAGQINEFAIYESLGNYLAMQNSEFEPVMPETILTDTFCCALREEDSDLKNELDEAILQISTDGTLADLVKIYLNEIAHGEEPPAVEMPAFYGGSTIYIGVTGTLPLLDYTRSDGQPAGFNTAILAEISKRIEKNFVLVPIDSGDRAEALTSRKVDVIFWEVIPQGQKNIPAAFDKPEGTILTQPYFSDTIVYIRLKQ